ncbi:MAG: hypothetical protein Kow0040_29720 [Thermogutta sp.]
MNAFCLGTWLGLAVAAVITTATVRAGDFAVESRVYAGNGDRPLSESLTVVVGEKAYDFLADPSEITIVDAAAKRVRLLNPGQRTQAEIDFATLGMFTERLRQRLADHEDRDFRFFARPEFAITHDGASGTFEFGSPRLTYRIQTFRADPTLAGVYWRTSDWLCRLNLLLHPGSPNPLARLEVNAVLESQGVLPRSVELTPAPKNLIDWLPQRRAVIRSDHVWHEPPKPEMLRRTAEADRAADEFRRLPLSDYLGKTGKP